MNTLKSMLSEYRGLSKSAYIIFIGRLITNMGAFIFPLLTLIMTDKMGYSAFDTALIMSLVGILFLPANIIGGKLADRYNRKKIIIYFDLVSVFFFMLCAFVEPGTMMLVFFVIAGLFANMEGPAFDALIVDVSKPDEREKVYALMYLGHNIGYTFGAAIGGLLFANYLNVAFIFDGLTTISSTLLIVLFVKAIPKDSLKKEERNEYEDHVEHKTHVLNILKTRPSISIQLVVLFLASFVYDQWSYILPMYMSDVFGSDLGSKYYGFLSSFNGFVVIIFTPLLTIWLKKWFELPKVILGQLLIGTSFLIIMGQSFYPIFFLMMFFFTLGEIINMLGTSPFLSRRIPASHLGRVSSYRNIAYFAGGAIGRVIIGAVVEKSSFNAAYLIIVAVGLLATGIAVYNYHIDKLIFPKLYTKKALKEALKGE